MAVGPSAREKARKFSAVRSARPIGTSDLADFLAGCVMPDETLIVGVTGSVASGKSTLSAALATDLSSTQPVEIISTDGFLLSNDELSSRNLVLRKGFPESYDFGLMSSVLLGARHGPVRVPGYSHQLYDRCPDLDRTIDRPGILFVEGLGLTQGPELSVGMPLLDLLIYIDASEQDLEVWFVDRFMRFWREAEGDPASFYSRFRSMSDRDAEAFARSVWNGINLPNLRNHISPMRSQSDIVVTKGWDHALYLGGVV